MRNLQPTMIRRRALSPRGYAQYGAAPPQKSRCASCFRLTLLAMLIGGLVYFATGFQEAVESASAKMSVLRSSASESFHAKSDLVGLTAKDDVVELIRPASDVSSHGGDDGRDDVKPEDAEDEHELGEDEQPEQSPRHEENHEVARPDEGDEPAKQAPVKLHEEDDALDADDNHHVIAEDRAANAADEVEEDLDTEEHAVDDNAHDVVVEPPPAEDEEDEEDDIGDVKAVGDSGAGSGESPAEGPKPIPKFKREELEERGFGHVLYAYRVVAPNVAIRTKPSPIGALQQTSKDKTGLVKDSAKTGEIVVGYKLAKVHGLWLKIGPYTWAPVTKKESLDGPFYPVMKQIRKISIPGNLRKYWRMRVLDCEALYKKLESRQLCQEKNMIRDGVLNVMRRMKLMEPAMDPELHPWPSKHPLRRLHATSMTDLELSNPAEPSNEKAEPSPASASATADADIPGVGKLLGSLIKLTEDGGAPQTTLASEIASGAKDDAAAESSGGEETSQASPMGENADATAGDEVDDVDTDDECRQFKFWHLCARHAKCAWRRHPNKEFCDLDVDALLGMESVPVELRQDPKYDFVSSLKRKPTQKYFVYQPSGGWNNQRLLMESALIVCKLLNRTCILPPAAPHSNYFQNYNNIPASALTGMSRVVDFEALNKVVSTVTIPHGMTFKSFLDGELLQTPRKHSVKTVFRDVTKYKPGAMKKWGERDIVSLFGDEKADVIYFANQTLWGAIEWKGLVAGWKQRKEIHLALTYPNHMKKVALKLADRMGPFHAIHVRRGDKVFETSFSRLYHDPEWFAERLTPYRGLSSKVYIATDEPNRAYFDDINKYQLSMVFWESLPGYDEILRPYLQHFPKRMFSDILGMVEQLLCAYAVKFLGSGYSTFTTFILRLRKYRDILAVDTSVPNPQLSLPASVRDSKSTCDPLKSLTHSTPC